MIAGHYAAGMIAHQRCPRGSLGFFLVASQLQDFAWLCFHFLGLEPTQPDQAWDMSLSGMVVEMTYSHDLVPVLGWTVAVGRSPGRRIH